MLAVSYIINFNKHKSKRDKRFTVYETNLYRRGEEKIKTGPVERKRPIVERERPVAERERPIAERERPVMEKEQSLKEYKGREREPVRSKSKRRPRENFTRTAGNKENLDL